MSKMDISNSFWIVFFTLNVQKYKAFFIIANSFDTHFWTYSTFKGNWFEKVVSKCALLESTFFVTSYANFYIVRSMILQIKIVRKWVLWQFMSGWEIKFVIESLQFEFSLKSNININVPKVSNFLIFFVISWEFMLNRMNLRSLSNFFLLYLNIDS